MTQPPPGSGQPWGLPADAVAPRFGSPWQAPYPPTHEPSGLPADHRGRFAQPWVFVLVGILVAAVIGGGVGAITGHLEADGKPAASADQPALTVPNATLPVTGPTLPAAQAPGSVAAIAAAVLPSVVTIQVRNSTLTGTGSGVILRSDGYILTNNHVVEPALSSGTLTVDLTATDTNIPARIVGRSPSDDLAVVKIDRTNLRAARLGHSSSLQVGDLVVAIGAPLGLSGSVSSGIVSALGRNVDVPSGSGSSQKVTVLGGAIQTDAAINPGNSGGALVDSTGAVVGIDSAIASLGSSGSSDAQTGSIGVGFAIPIDYAASVATEIIRTGTVTHPYIGISLTTLSPSTASPGGPQNGALVKAVVAGGPGAKAGMQVDDVIVGIGSTAVRSADDLIVATRSYAIGQTAQLKVVRGGATLTVPVVLGENPNG